MNIGLSFMLFVNTLTQQGFRHHGRFYARRRDHSFAALRHDRSAGRQARLPTRATGAASTRAAGAASTKAAGAADREVLGARKGAAVSAPHRTLQRASSTRPA